ncbi:hypothetical protein HY745_04380 [Candidatus Desantisbacteria bacterium]|nr:hypothetical protein [Candidatus Desantisbacteria bacterium]
MLFYKNWEKRLRKFSCFFVFVFLFFSNCNLTFASVSGANVNYTVDADFDQGVLFNVNHDAPNSNQLQLNVTTTPFPIVNIAASARGTVVRIDVNTGAILGEYLTSPDGMGRNPSRTTVDQLGNVWVANRDEYGFSGGQNKGSVVRIWLIIGGTRANADGTPNPSGQYLKPPFQYSTCIDRNGDGLIKTSIGLGNILPWTNLGGADSDGGVSTAEDEAIINYTRVTGTGTRTLAVDASNDLWVGGLGDTDFEKLSGVTGLPIPGTQFNLGLGGYGGLIDGNGILWSAPSPLLRFDPVTMTGIGLDNAAVGFTYGIGIDPNTGNIWTTDNSGPNVREIDPLTGATLNIYPLPVSNGWGQGIAVDSNSHVWAAEGFGDEVAHFAPDPVNPGKHIFVGSVIGLGGTTGVAVDTNGKIWASEMNSNSASRINPNAGLIGAGGYNIGAIDMIVPIGDGAGPYNYSDMTGFVAIGSTSPQGFWTVVQNSGTPGTNWNKITWNTEPQGSEPPGSSIIVEARASDTEIGLSSQTFVSITNAVDFNLPGQFIEVQVTLKIASNASSPVLSDIRIQAKELIQIKGRMTGGGSIAGTSVKHGFELHCDAAQGPNNLQINWGKSSKFHLEKLDEASGSDDPAISEGQPVAGFDTYKGKGTGRYNGKSGAIAEWTFTDAGEPGKNDFAKIIIKNAEGVEVLNVSGNLNNGNHQAHKE